MSRAETYAWASLVTNGLIFAFFSHRVLDGWTPADLTPKHMFWTYVAFVVLTIIAESVIAGVLATRGAWLGDALVEDERDRKIERRAGGVQLTFLMIAINVLVFQLMADLAFPGNVFPRVDLTHAPTLFYALMASLAASHVVKLIATILAYRR